MIRKGKDIFILVFFSILIFFLSVFLKVQYNESNKIIDYKDSAIDYVIFEGVGNYAFATAGNNNAYRGTTYDANDYTWIQSFPESDKVSYDWEDVKQKILQETGLTEITNMSGSYLNIDGKIHKAMLGSVISKMSGTGYEGRVLFLYPDGSYRILNFNTTSWMNMLDITDLLENASKGWYYVSYLDAEVIPQCAWAITAIYENPNIARTYIKMLNVNTRIANGQEISVLIEPKLKLQNNYQLIGVLMLAGSNGFQVLNPEHSASTMDRAFAILDDGSEFQLYDRNDGHFVGRTDIDFANDIYGTQRSHNVSGGELDIFDERLNSEYFGDKGVHGFRFIKDGKNLLNISILGLSQTIVDAKLNVETEITAPSKFKEGSKISISSVITNILENNYCFESYNNNITSYIDGSLSNVTNIDVKLNGNNLSYEYDESNGKIIVNSSSIKCNDVIAISYDAVVNSNIDNGIVDNKYIITATTNINYSLVDLDSLTPEEIEEYSALKTDLSVSKKVESPKYVTLTINHLAYANGKLDDSEVISGYYGESYTTSSSSLLSTNYNTVVPYNAIGTFTNNGNVNYYYELKDAILTVHHYLEGTTKSLTYSESHSKKWTEQYTTSPSNLIDECYELVEMPDNASGVISGDVTVIYYYRLKSAKLIVHHYIEGTTNKLVADEIYNKKWTDNYTTNSSSDVSSNYELVSLPSNAVGIIKGDVEVTYYYRLKKSTLLVKYLEKDTNEVLATEIKKVVYYGEKYTTEESDKVTANYELYTKTDNYNGIVDSDLIEIIYYYQKKNSELSSSIIINSEDELLSKEQTIRYEIKYEANINVYIGNAEITIVNKLPYKIDTDKSKLNGGIYNNEDGTITWIIKENNIDASLNNKKIEVIRNIELLYKDIDAEERIMTSTINGEIVLDNNDRKVENKKVIYLKIPGKIVVHHYLVDTEDKIGEDEIIEDLVGEIFISGPINKDGYKVVKEPEDKNHKYKEELTEVIYEYERIKYDIITKVEGDDIGGTITGSESIYHGDNSTENNIVIKPFEGFEVSKIMINGEEIQIDECKNGCVLGAFLNITRNQEVVVTFSKKIINPETKTFNIKFIVILILLMGSIILLLKKYNNVIFKL